MSSGGREHVKRSDEIKLSDDQKSYDELEDTCRSLVGEWESTISELRQKLPTLNYFTGESISTKTILCLFSLSQ